MMSPRFQTHQRVLTPAGRLDLDRLEADSDRQVQQEQQHLRLHPDYQSRRPRRQPHRGQQVAVRFVISFKELPFYIQMLFDHSLVRPSLAD